MNNGIFSGSLVHYIHDRIPIYITQCFLDEDFGVLTKDIGLI